MALTEGNSQAGLDSTATEIGITPSSKHSWKLKRQTLHTFSTLENSAPDGATSTTFSDTSLRTASNFQHFFGAQNAFHELVIPSIMHIVDQTRCKHEFTSIFNFMAHCYGGCCAGGADLNQLMSHRCGHKLDYLGNQTVINAHYEGLDQEAAGRGIEIEDVQVERYQNFSSFGKSLSSTAKAAYEEVVVRPLPNHWSWNQVDYAFDQTD